MADKKKKDNENDVQEKIRWNDQAYNISGKNAKEAMETLSVGLKSSEKGGLFGGIRGNSEYFRNVESGLADVLQKLDETFTGKMQEDVPVMEQIAYAYGRLIEACEAYNSRKVRTDKGRTRQGIVGKIQERAETDRRKLAEYFGSMAALPEQERAKTPVEALEKARRRTVELPYEHKHLGGAASDVLQFKENGSDKNVYFKGEELFQKKESWQYALDAMAEVQSDEKYAIPKSQYEEAVNDILESERKNFAMDAVLQSKPAYMNNVRYHEFVDRATAKNKAIGTIHTHITGKSMANIGNDGKEVNVTNRNVAASRFADLLGVGDLIARSETVNLRSSDGTEKKGILMEEAGRKEGKEARRQLVENYRQEQNNTDGKGTLPDARTHVKSAMSAEFQRSVADLQVLDALMGQVDRHSGNYMTDIDIKDGKLGAVKGIDNDFSFGLTTLKGDDVGPKKGVIGNHGRSPVDREGQMVIPYMSERLMEGILAVTEGQLEFILKDLLEPEVIKACWERVSEMQKAILLDIKNFETNGGTYRYLKDDEWNQETLEAFLSQDRENYLSNYVKKSFIDDDEKDIREAGNLKLAKQFWDDQAKEFNFKDPKTVYKFLEVVTQSGNGNVGETLKYIDASGLIEQWCMEGRKGMEFHKLPSILQVQIRENVCKPEILAKLDSI